MALILYDFAAYLSTDLIQPGIINVVREFDADVSLAPAAVSLYLAGGMALQWLLGPLSDRIGRRPVLVTGALIFSLACTATLFTTSMTQFLVARVVQGTSICFIATVGYVTVQEAFGQTKAIKLMAIITSIVLVAPIIGPLSGAALMHFVHWKVLFAIIAVMGFIAFMGLLLAMPETVQRGAVPFSAISVVRDFRDVFRNRVFLFGVATISLSYIPMMSWVAVSPVILIDAGGMTSSQFAWVQVPVFGAVIVANMVVARFVKDPTNPRFIWRAVPIQLQRPVCTDRREPALASRVAVVGVGHQSVCVWHWANLPDAVPLHAVYQQPAERNRVGLAEHGHSGGDGRFRRNRSRTVV